MKGYSDFSIYLGDLEDRRVFEFIDRFLERNPTKIDANDLIKSAQVGMAIIGDRFQRGEYFVGDLIFGGEILTEIIDIVQPIIGKEITSDVVGVIVLGTVYGDLHDIGKNIFKIMSESAGFKVYDIGIDQPIKAFVDAVREHKPDIVGMSGVLTLALDSMKNTVDGLIEENLRNDVKIIIGGSPVNKDASQYIGSDDFTANALEGLSICQNWMKEKKLFPK